MALFQIALNMAKKLHYKHFKKQTSSIDWLFYLIAKCYSLKVIFFFTVMGGHRLLVKVSVAKKTSYYHFLKNKFSVF